MDELIQCVLMSGEHTLVTWLNNDKRIKCGVWVTLSDTDEPQKKWCVKAIGSKIQAQSIISAHNSDIIHKKDFVRSKSGGFKNVGKK